MYLLQYNNIRSYMKPILAASKTTKPSLYQQYRSKNKSELNCSIHLLSELNDIDHQMQQYQRLRNKRMSHSQIQTPNLKEISNAKITSKQVEQVKYTQQKSERYFPVKLQIIEECQTNVKTGRAVQNMTNSCIVSTKTNTLASKPAVVRASNVNSKQQEEKRSRLDALREKTKQLQQQLLSVFSGDAVRKNVINKQMAILMQLFQ